VVLYVIMGYEINGLFEKENGGIKIWNVKFN
jgi:hypothetical protein